MTEEQMLEGKKVGYRWGIIIFGLLLVLTLGEYGISQVGQNIGSVLMIIALFKAALVVRDYMHVGKLFTGEEEH